MSEGLGEEWVYVDLGALCILIASSCTGLRAPPMAAIQVSDDAEKWTNLHSFQSESGLLDDVKLPRPAQAATFASS